MKTYSSSRGFTLIEVIVVAAVISILAAVSIVLVGNVREGVNDQKLKKDVSSLNSAVKVYLANGGSLDGVTDAQVVLARLKTVAGDASKKRIVGIKGSALDVRMVIEEQSSSEEASDDLRAIWNKNTQRFDLATAGGNGIARFLIDDRSAVDGGSESRATNLQYAKNGRWVWDYTDRSAGSGTPPSGVPGGLGTPGTPTTEAPPAEPLDAPIIEIPGVEYALTDFPMTVSISNPNTVIAEGASELMYSIDSAVWVLYTGPVTVGPGETLEAIAISIDPDNWVDSPVDDETYTAARVRPELEVTLPSSANYFELGGEVMPNGSSVGTTYDVIDPGLVSLANAADIPDEFESSALFQIYWTSDGSNPLSSPTRTSGAGFSNGFVDQEIVIDLDSWPAGETELSVNVAAEALDTNVFVNSIVSETTITGDVLDLRAPMISVSGETVQINLVTENFDMPTGARVYYTTDGTVPGIGPDNEPTSGTLYSGAFTLEDDVDINARVFPPLGAEQWFNPSSETSEEFVSPFTREVYIGGRFAMGDGMWRNIARLNEAGGVDPGFNPGLGASFGSTVGALLPQAGGRVLAGGDFDTMNNEVRQALARLLPDGSVDTSFNAAIE